METSRCTDTYTPGSGENMDEVRRCRKNGEGLTEFKIRIRPDPPRATPDASRVIKSRESKAEMNPIQGEQDETPQHERRTT